MVHGRSVPFANEQLGSIRKLALYELASSIDVEIIAEPHIEQIEIDNLKRLLEKKFPKVKYSINNQNYFEYFGFKKMYEISQEDDNSIILYFHSKGIFSNSHQHRWQLFRYTILNYRDYISEFEKNPELDLAGICPHTKGFIYFNYLWVRSSFIKNYCPMPVPNENRYVWESEYWISGNKDKIVMYSPFFKYDIQNTFDIFNLPNV